MLMLRSGSVLLLLLLLQVARAGAVCDEIVPSALMVVRPVEQVPLAVGFAALPVRPIGAPRDVLGPAYEQTQSVDYVIYRMRLDDCRAIAVANAIATAVATTDYVKLTEFDNTPYRFNLVQNGKRMTADDFDVWLRANGYDLGPRVEPEASGQQ